MELLRLAVRGQGDASSSSSPPARPGEQGVSSTRGTNATGASATGAGGMVQDAVLYLTSEDDLRLAMATAFVHCRPGGVALFAPDFVRETFAPATTHGGHDGDGRALRYLAWIHDPDPADT